MDFAGEHTIRNGSSLAHGEGVHSTKVECRGRLGVHTWRGGLPSPSSRPCFLPLSVEVQEMETGVVDGVPVSLDVDLAISLFTKARTLA